MPVGSLHLPGGTVQPAQTFIDMEPLGQLPPAFPDIPNLDLTQMMQMLDSSDPA